MKTGDVTTVTVKINKLFRPAAVAVIGASEDPESVGYALLKNLLSGGYRGEIYPVNPRYAGQKTGISTEMQCLPYVASADELPENRIDLALVATPARTVPGIAAQLGENGIEAVVVISAGFGEAGEAGQTLANQLKEQVERYDLLIVGPNCLGVANAAEDIRLNATFADLAAHPSHGAIFSQSGAVGIDWINRASQTGLNFRQFVSLGNSLILQPQSLLKAWLTDPDVHYVMGYLESGASLAALREIAPAFTRQKPLMLLQAGLSEAGAKAAQSHTGALAGNKQAVQAFAEQVGIQRFDDTGELLAAAEAFEHASSMRGNRIAVVSNAGGYAVMATDWLTSKKATDLMLSSLSDDTLKTLKDLLPKNASARNPLDTTATFPADAPEAFHQVLDSIAADPGVDACLLAIVDIMELPVEQIVQYAAEVQASTGKPVVCMLSSGRLELRDLKQHCRELDVKPVALYSSLSDALIALSALNRHRLWKERTAEAERPTLNNLQNGVVGRILAQVQAEGRSLVTTAESLDILQAYGIRIAPYQIATTVEQALTEAEQLGYPVAIKLNSKSVTHKTEVGGVKVDLRSPEELRAEFCTMMARLSDFGISAFEAGEGIMIQTYMPKGRELILGAKTDPDFGKLILIGRGGIYAPIDRDTKIRLNPVNLADIRDMISGIRAYAILKGYRGKPGIDFETLEQTMLRLSRLIEDFPGIQELDINPYLVLPVTQGSGAAVDARIILG